MDELGHSFEESFIKLNPTSQENGIEVIKCIRCNIEVEYEINLSDTFLFYDLINDEYYEITGYRKDKVVSSEINISSTYRGLPVKSIKTLAFEDCTDIEKIIIPSSVTSIGYRAFQGCKNLNSITIPFIGDSLENTTYFHFGYIFGASSYDYNSECVPSTLKEVILTECKKIEPSAFNGCVGIESITLPMGLTSIGENAFYNCTSLNEVYYNGTDDLLFDIMFQNENTYLTDYAKYFYLLDENNQYKEITEIRIPNTVTSIQDFKLKNFKNITNIIIPNGVKSIGESAFSGCSSLSSIKIPENVKTIGKDAFLSCYNLVNVYYNGSLVDWCNIKFGDYTSNPMHYGKYFFMLDGNNEYQELTEIIIPSNVTTIGCYQFDGFDNVTSVMIPENVISIGYHSFYGCKSLKSITLPFIGEKADRSSETHFGYIFGNLSYYVTYSYIPNSLNEVVITSGEIIDDYAFYRCTNLKSITLPNSLNVIGEYAFYDCTNLRSINLPNNLNVIGENAFSNCNNLTNIDIPTSITEIGEYSFSACNALTSIEILCDNIDIGKFSFINCSSLTTVKISGVNVNIDNYAFSSCSNLLNLTISEGVNRIGKSAFFGCNSLTSITLPFVGEKADGTGVKNLGYIFEESSIFPNTYITPPSLKEVIVTSGTSIEEYAFSKCSNLTSITIPESVTSIEEGAFSDCSSLTSITIPESVTSIAKGVFRECTSLTNIEIPTGIKDIENATFLGCTSLKNIVLPTSITSIGQQAFEYCTSLTNIELPIGVVSISSSAFQNCTSLENVKLPFSLTSIGEYAFRGCTKLTNIEIPSSVTSIAKGVFKECTSLFKISVPFIGEKEDGSGKTHFGYIFGAGTYYENAFCIPTSLKEIVVTSGTIIDEGAFYNCEYLTNIEISNSVTEIGYDAFRGCTSLTSIKLPFVGERADGTGATYLGYIFGASELYGHDYYVPSSLKEIIISGETNIEESAFKGCTNITSITIASNIKSIGEKAFWGCNKLTSIELPSSVTFIGEYAFSGCENLTIYCQVNTLPNEWHENWNNSNCPVIWGYVKND